MPSKVEIMNTGPFYGWIAPELSNRFTSLHRASSDWLLALIGLHVIAVAFYIRLRRQPLVRAMITGRKPAAEVPVAESITGSRVLLAAVIVAALAAALALVLRVAPEATIALF